MRETAISSKFFIHRVSKQCTLGNFPKKFPLPKNDGHFEFSKFCLKCKNKLASFYLTVRDRAISSKFSIRRVLTKLLVTIFKNISSLTRRDRTILSKFLTHRVSKQCKLGNFQKIFLSPKKVAILNFQIFAKNGK